MELDSQLFLQLRKRLDDAAEFLHIDDKKRMLAKLDAQSSEEGFWQDVAKAQEISKQAGVLRESIAQYTRACSLFDDAHTAFELSCEDEAFVDEASALTSALQEHIEQLELTSWFTGRFDAGDAILSINPGQGGLEANDWTDMLFQMYLRYAQQKGWHTSVLDATSSEVIGLDRATIQIEGLNAYGMLRSEIGVHRLVRISPTDEKQRRHTTFASVEVLPVLPDEVEVIINPADVRVDVYRSSGPGGQCVNTTDSAVRLTHIPTGLVVTCQNQKSQLQNKEAAFRVLRARLYELEAQKRAEKLESLRGERHENSFGSQIRNYVLYPYQLVKDLRSGVETGNVDAVLQGDIDSFVIGYHKWNAARPTQGK